jgi:cyclase
MDVREKSKDGQYEVMTLNAKKHTGKCPVEFARQMENLGAGEIVVNSIDNDGAMKGYNLDLAGKIYESVTVPVTVLGGAGTLKDIGKLIERFGIIGAAAGSLFVFKGVYRAVLINYPGRSEKDALIGEHYRG